MRIFHSQNGLCFERLENGSVRIVKFVPETMTSIEGGSWDGTIEFEQTVDDGTWCSIVLTMSDFNERPNDWHWWMQHHNGKVDARQETLNP